MSFVWLRRLVSWRGWRVFVSVAAGIYIASAIDLQQVVQVVDRVNLPLLLTAMGVYVISMNMRALRWFLLLRRRRPVPFLILLQLNSVAMLGATFLPSSLGEDAIRITLLNRYIESAADAISATLLERITSIMALAVFAGTGACQLRKILAESLASLTYGASTLWTLALVLAAALFATLTIWRLPREYQLRTYLADMFQDIWQILQIYLADPTLLIVSVLLSFTLPIGTVFANYLLARALGIPVTLASISLVVPVILILATMPISLGSGLGLREGLYMLMFRPFGVLPEQAFALALITRFVLFLVTLGGALPYMLFGPY